MPSGASPSPRRFSAGTPTVAAPRSETRLLTRGFRLSPSFIRSWTTTATHGTTCSALRSAASTSDPQQGRSAPNAPPPPSLRVFGLRASKLLGWWGPGPQPADAVLRRWDEGSTRRTSCGRKSGGHRPLNGRPAEGDVLFFELLNRHRRRLANASAMRGGAFGRAYIRSM